MNEPFDLFLAEALAPPARGPDRNFVAQVQARIDLDERLRGQARAILRRMVRDLVALASVAAAFALLTRAPAVAELGARMPDLLLCGAIACFAILLLALARPNAAGPWRPKVAGRR